MSNGHFKTICKHCDKVIEQCRCFGPHTINYELCNKCKENDLGECTSEKIMNGCGDK